MLLRLMSILLYYSFFSCLFQAAAGKSTTHIHDMNHSTPAVFFKDIHSMNEFFSLSRKKAVVGVGGLKDIVILLWLIRQILELDF